MAHGTESISESRLHHPHTWHHQSLRNMWIRYWSPLLSQIGSFQVAQKNWHCYFAIIMPHIVPRRSWPNWPDMGFLWLPIRPIRRIFSKWWGSSYSESWRESKHIKKEMIH
jgi:hypothetical protein